MNPTPSPPHFSPIAALTKRAFLWVVCPAGLLGLVIYGLANMTSPAQEEANRTARDLAKKLSDADTPGRLRIDEMRNRAAAHPDAASNEAAMKDLTPQQRAARRKEFEDDWKRKNGIK